jgi:hypothetical protein
VWIDVEMVAEHVLAPPGLPDRVDPLGQPTALHPTLPVVRDAAALDLDHRDTHARQTDDQIEFVITTLVGEPHVRQQRVIHPEPALERPPHVPLRSRREVRLGRLAPHHRRLSLWSVTVPKITDRLKLVDRAAVGRKQSRSLIANERWRARPDESEIDTDKSNGRQMHRPSYSDLTRGGATARRRRTWRWRTTAARRQG